MKIVICASLSFPEKILEVKEELEELGHKIFIPPTTYAYLEGRRVKGDLKQDLDAKKHVDAIRLYYNEISHSDCILVLNYTKKGIKNYIGPNTLIEIAFAHVLNKKIYLLNPVPEMDIKSEVVHMNPRVINGDLNIIKP